MLKLLENRELLERYERLLMTALRICIGVVFVWFGALKIFGFNPVFDLVFNSLMPMLAYGAGLIILGIAEVLIGLMILSNRMILLAHLLLFGHLLGTFTTFLFGWGVVFQPYFPVLSLDGEFVVKNAVLAISGLAVLIHELKHKKE